MLNLFWDLHQSSQIREAQASARSAAGRAGETADRVGDIESRIDRLALVCRAMWSLIQENSDLTEEDLLCRVKKIDLSDGKLDGKVASKIAKCGKCGQTMSKRHQRCLYCGAKRLLETVFDEV